MRSRLIVAVLLVLPAVALAQVNVVGGTRMSHPQPAVSANSAPGFAFPGGFKPPDGLFDEFWNDPAMSAELHLSDAQRKRLQEAALEQRLALIDSGAGALKAVLKLSAILDAEPYDDEAYKKQLAELSDATGKAVQNLGEMAAAPRRVLSPEQWAKLKTLKKAKQAAAKAAAAQHQPSITVQPARP